MSNLPAGLSKAANLVLPRRRRSSAAEREGALVLSGGGSFVYGRGKMFREPLICLPMDCILIYKGNFIKIWKTALDFCFPGWIFFIVESRIAIWKQ